MNDKLRKLEFSGNYIFNNLGIDAYGVIFQNKVCKCTCYSVFYNPIEDTVWLFNENNNASMEIEGFEKAVVINKMKKAYVKKHNRDLVDTWQRFVELHQYNYA